MASSPPAKASLLLKGRDTIALVFRVNPYTVTKWAKEKAPLWKVGTAWHTDYYALIEWLISHRPAHPK